MLSDQTHSEPFQVYSDLTIEAVKAKRTRNKLKFFHILESGCSFCFLKYRFLKINNVFHIFGSWVDVVQVSSILSFGGFLGRKDQPLIEQRCLASAAVTFYDFRFFELPDSL